MPIENPLLRKAVFRTFLSIRSRRSKDPIESAALQKLLGDRDLFDAVYDGVEAEAMVGTPLTDLLQWLLDNGPAIIAMIEQIIALFSAPAVTESDKVA